MARLHTHGDLLGRLLAVLVLLVGIAALVFVFITAVHLFQSPVPGLGLPVPNGQPPPTGLNIGVALALLFSRLAILTLMILAGSLIASKGIHLYLGAVVAHHPLDRHTDVTEPPAADSTKKTGQ